MFDGNAVTIALCAVVCFLIGSIPWGVIISKAFFNKDVRDTGSGNIGFTNSMRALGKAGGAAVFLLDFAKGLASAAIGVYLIGGLEWMGAFASACAVMGHIFSPWLNFKGGKGISTAFGASFIAISAPLALGLFAVFLLVVIATKYVSAGSIIAAFLYPFAGIYAHQSCTSAWIFFILIGVVVIWAHRENILRILSGTEHKIGSKSKQSRESD